MNPDDDNIQTLVTSISGTMVFHYRIIEKIGAGSVVQAKKMLLLK